MPVSFPGHSQSAVPKAALAFQGKRAGAWRVPAAIWAPGGLESDLSRAPQFPCLCRKGRGWHLWGSEGERGHLCCSPDAPSDDCGPEHP